MPPLYEIPPPNKGLFFIVCAFWAIMAELAVIVEAKDVGGIVSWMKGLVERGEKQKLLATYQYLKALSEKDDSRAWLRDTLSQNDVQDLWFIFYVKTNPGEVIFSLEYDFFSRHKTSNYEIISDNAVVYGLVDLMLGVNYANAKGPRKGIHGDDFFLNASPKETMKDKLCRDDFLLVDYYLLRPPCADVSKWTMLHILVRRVAFLLLSGIIDRYGFDVENQRAIGQYVGALSIKRGSVGSDADLKNFFQHDGVLGFVDGWDALLEDVVLHATESLAEFSFIGEGDTEYKFPFMYRSSAESQAVFYKRIEQG
jgi:hypothetical protein